MPFYILPSPAPPQQLGVAEQPYLTCVKSVSIARLTRTVLDASNVPAVRTGSRRAAGSAGRRRQWRSVWRGVRKDAGSVLARMVMD